MNTYTHPHVYTYTPVHCIQISPCAHIHAYMYTCATMYAVRLCDVPMFGVSLFRVLMSDPAQRARCDEHNGSATQSRRQLLSGVPLQVRRCHSSQLSVARHNSCSTILAMQVSARLLCTEGKIASSSLAEVGIICLHVVAHVYICVRTWTHVCASARRE